MNPNKRQQVTVSFCCSIAFIKTKLSSNKILYFNNQVHLPIQSCFKSQKPKHNSNAYGYHRLNVVHTSQSARMPRFLACPAIYVSKIGPKTSQE